MIDTPVIVQTQRQPTAVIHLTIPRDQIQVVMGPAIQEVMGVVGAEGIIPQDALFAYHLTMSPDVFDFEVGVPVAELIAPNGRVIPSHLPAAKVVRTVYHGPYEGLAEAWGKLDQWLADNGYEPVGDLWEVYQAGPETGDDSSKWRTEFNRPVK
ncbi:GyrI-like domain-containing protein [Asticcacaulis endophyticus]|uniref:Transcriptional regulator n=1 Tax=Asticcacaulis endophyticus TaxID=1395890 RepID=A0A918UNK4_9CAUL|nr:GyrI-like domain-containing protein [Asticcacaulis endophyticus]GGZ23114.1 transcriptional regulator [Asticcacaulis endophyticus]